MPKWLRSMSIPKEPARRSSHGYLLMTIMMVLKDFGVTMSWVSWMKIRKANYMKLDSSTWPSLIKQSGPMFGVYVSITQFLLLAVMSCSLPRYQICSSLSLWTSLGSSLWHGSLVRLPFWLLLLVTSHSYIKTISIKWTLRWKTLGYLWSSSRKYETIFWKCKEQWPNKMSCKNSFQRFQIHYVSPSRKKSSPVCYENKIPPFRKPSRQLWVNRTKLQSPW